MDFTQFIQHLLDGFSTGSIYALVALGYTMVYGIIKLINFAHGDFIMVGCYVAWLVTDFLLAIGAQIWLIIIICILTCIITIALLAFLTEKIAYKPLRNSKKINVLITAIAVEFILQNLWIQIFGTQAKIYPANNVFSFPSFKLGELIINTSVLFAVGLLIVCTVLLTLFVKKTKTGKAMQCVSENKNASQLMGIDVNKTISITFIIGGAIAGLSSILYCIYYKSMTPTLGSMLGIKAFVSAVLGGIGSIPGAVIGGILIGLTEQVVGIWIIDWVDVITFAILILILLVKPSGILGKSTKEKV